MAVFRGPVRRVVFAALGYSLACYGQSLSLGLSSGTGVPGATVNLNLSVDTLAGSAPAAMQWTLNYPGADFTSAQVTAGPVANAASKVVTCVPGAGSAVCMLWGDNSMSMANGVAAVVSMTISPATQNASSQIQITSSAAASPAAYPVTSSATGGTVTIVQAASLNSLTCLASTLSAPASTTCTIGLTSGAPIGGAVIGLAASPADLAIPSSVTVLAGVNSAIFLATAMNVTSPAPVNVTATYLGESEGFGVTVDPPTVVPKSLVVSPSVISSGQSATGTVTLSAPAGSGGVSVALSSSSAAAVVPAAVTVPQGASTATFPVAAGSVSTATPVALTATYAGGTATAGMTIDPPITVTGLILYPNKLDPGQTSAGTVMLSAPAGVGGVVVTLADSNTAALTVPASVTIAQGATSAGFTATPLSVTKGTELTVTASYGTASRTASVLVKKY